MTLSKARLRREFTRFAKFTVVGTIGAVVDFGTFNLLTALLRVWYVFSGMVSFSMAVLSNFIWHRYWIYPDSRSKPLGQQALQFALVNLVGLAIRMPILFFTERPMIALADQALAWLPAPLLALAPTALTRDSTLLGHNLALATAVVVVLFWNFSVNRFWTYSDVE